MNYNSGYRLRSYILGEGVYSYVSEAPKSKKWLMHLLTLTADEALSFVPDNDIDIAKLLEENKALRDELTARRAEQTHQAHRDFLPRTQNRARAQNQ